MYSAVRPGKSSDPPPNLGGPRGLGSWVPSGDATVSEASLRDVGNGKVTGRLPMDKVAFMPSSRTVGVTATGR